MITNAQIYMNTAEPFIKQGLGVTFFEGDYKGNPTMEIAVRETFWVTFVLNNSGAIIQTHASDYKKNKYEKLLIGDLYTIINEFVKKEWN
ncbi:hypothetical protein LAU42_07220 [Macrococcus armenti]|uniref:hypothetical protein n=1 Tax=Macrococcus armenti TaxID=2875764 RepID=UPI001CCC7104|nr:hypothetical protein [Macrococcus armenti]UBH21586.1 hypothetical protein LAU42_07220 [Macrococcus armenti]